MIANNLLPLLYAQQIVLYYFLNRFITFINDPIMQHLLSFDFSPIFKPLEILFIYYLIYIVLITQFAS